LAKRGSVSWLLAYPRCVDLFQYIGAAQTFSFVLDMVLTTDGSLGCSTTFISSTKFSLRVIFAEVDMLSFSLAGLSYISPHLFDTLLRVSVYYICCTSAEFDAPFCFSKHCLPLVFGSFGSYFYFYFFLSKIGVAVTLIVIVVSMSSCSLALSRMGFFSHGSLGKRAGLALLWFLRSVSFCGAVRYGCRLASTYILFLNLAVNISSDSINGGGDGMWY